MENLSRAEIVERLNGNLAVFRRVQDAAMTDDTHKAILQNLAIFEERLVKFIKDIEKGVYDAEEEL